MPPYIEFSLKCSASNRCILPHTNTSSPLCQFELNLQIEGYIKEHSEAEFTHSICPECAEKLYPDFYKKMDFRERE
ncbi:MAG: hypothetical protein VR65_26615 [Desulfobulbaceae bacterium BRH_c16a]|nr:MAG: hypothetical protein VR65_26615 [Desulfobulbaceae bacterium BRH_c16a]